MGIIGLFVGLVVAVILIGCLARAGKGFAHEMRTGEELPERFLTREQIARGREAKDWWEQECEDRRSSIRYESLPGNIWHDSDD